MKLIKWTINCCTQTDRRWCLWLLLKLIECKLYFKWKQSVIYQHTHDCSLNINWLVYVLKAAATLKVFLVGISIKNRTFERPYMLEPRIITFTNSVIITKEQNTSIMYTFAMSHAGSIKCANLKHEKLHQYMKMNNIKQ